MISPAEIKRAATVIEGHIIRTPLVYSPTFSSLAGFKVYLKLENLQITGSFKIRGATFKIQSELGRIGKGGVVAASAGNHAQGVALAASRAGLASTIVMPEWASISKQEATRGYGGEVILEGQSLADSIKKALELAKEGKTFIHPFDDPSIIAGQGTIGLEILEDLPDADLIAVPVGGGGLVSGICVAARALRPGIRIVGVQAQTCPSALRALETGRKSPGRGSPVNCRRNNGQADRAHSFRYNPQRDRSDCAGGRGPDRRSRDYASGAKENTCRRGGGGLCGCLAERGTQSPCGGKSCIGGKWGKYRHIFAGQGHSQGPVA